MPGKKGKKKKTGRALVPTKGWVETCTTTARKSPRGGGGRDKKRKGPAPRSDEGRAKGKKKTKPVTAATKHRQGDKKYTGAAPGAVG